MVVSICDNLWLRRLLLSPMVVSLSKRVWLKVVKPFVTVKERKAPYNHDTTIRITFGLSIRIYCPKKCWLKEGLINIWKLTTLLGL